MHFQIIDASQKKYCGKLCGLVLAGGNSIKSASVNIFYQINQIWVPKSFCVLIIIPHPEGSGAGKSTFCGQLSADKNGSRKHNLLRSKLVAAYMCPAR